VTKPAPRGRGVAPLRARRLEGVAYGSLATKPAPRGRGVLAAAAVLVAAFVAFGALAAVLRTERVVLVVLGAARAEDEERDLAAKCTLALSGSRGREGSGCVTVGGRSGCDSGCAACARGDSGSVDAVFAPEIAP
jgi:hypothetical protein